jgi:hypothetical protein
MFQSNAEKPASFFKAHNYFEKEMKNLCVGNFEEVFACKANLAYKANNIVGFREDEP